MSELTLESTLSQVDPRDYRRALGCFPTGVAIITTRDSDGTPVGLTCNSFSSVSLDPPLVQWSLRKNSRSLESFRRAGSFAINVLSSNQSEISSHFASASTDKFEGRDLDKDGLPFVDGCIARFRCRTAAEYDVGDHILFIGEVLAFEHHEQEPLVFFRGAYKIVAELLADIGKDGQLTAQHINEARVAIYSTVLRLACERATEDDLVQIEAKLDEIDSYLLAGQMEQRARAALELFQTIGYAAHNPVLAVVGQSLGSVMQRQVSASAVKMDWTGLHKPELVPIRRRILEHIRQRDADAAVQSLVDYIEVSPLPTWAY